MEIQTKISELRKKGGLTQQDMADTLNVSRQTISKWETGVVLPDVDNLSRIGKLFNVSIDFLLGTAFVEENTDEINGGLISALKNDESKVKFIKKYRIREIVFVICILYLAVKALHAPMTVFMYSLFFMVVGLASFMVKHYCDRTKK